MYFHLNFLFNCKFYNIILLNVNFYINHQFCLQNRLNTLNQEFYKASWLTEMPLLISPTITFTNFLHFPQFTWLGLVNMIKTIVPFEFICLKALNMLWNWVILSLESCWCFVRSQTSSILKQHSHKFLNTIFFQINALTTFDKIILFVPKFRTLSKLNVFKIFC